MRYLHLSIILFFSSQLWACDICSSAFEVVPNERKSSFGIYYSTVYRLGLPASSNLNITGHLNYMDSEVKESF